MAYPGGKKLRKILTTHLQIQSNFTRVKQFVRDPEYKPLTLKCMIMDDMDLIRDFVSYIKKYRGVFEVWADDAKCMFAYELGLAIKLNLIKIDDLIDGLEYMRKLPDDIFDEVRF
jgi:hypothetical protein